MPGQRFPRRPGQSWRPEHGCVPPAWSSRLATILVIVGAINWGLVGLFDLNLVTFLFGGVPALVTIVYLVVGLAGLWMIYLLVRAPMGSREATS